MSKEKPKTMLETIREQDEKKQRKIAVKLATQLRELLTQINSNSTYIESLLDAAGIKGEERSKLLTYLKGQTALNTRDRKKLEEKADKFLESLTKEDKTESF